MNHSGMGSARGVGRWTSDAKRWTAIGATRGAHRAMLVVTCLALVVAAVGDAATGYDGPGPQIDLALAAVVALARWWLTPSLAVLASAFFIAGGLANPSFAARLADPHDTLNFVAGWVQMLGFAVSAVCALAALVLARRPDPHKTITDTAALPVSPPTSRTPSSEQDRTS
jgi:hypothetical protein